MSSSKTKLRANEIMPMIAAVVTGASFRVGFDAAAKKFPVIMDNYLMSYGLTSGLIGSSLVYFGKSQSMKASGYGLLAMSGTAFASKIGDAVSTGSSPMNGASVRETCGNVNTALSARKKYTMPGAGVGIVQDKTPAYNSNANPYAMLAYSDAIYPIK